MTISSVDLKRPQPARVEGSSANSRLVNYALRGLGRCWLPEYGRWSHIHHLDGRASPNESVAHSDVFYTLNVLLGMSRVAEIPEDLNLVKIYRRNAQQLTLLPVRKYAFGMALWAGAELDLETPEEVAREARSLLTDQAAWRTFHAQDLGMLLIGIVAQLRAGRGQWHPFATPLFRFLAERFQGGSGLFFDTPAGPRRRFASFATQIYLSIACYQYADLTGDPEALAMASACAAKLIALQGPQGEWPWFYDAVSGHVLDFYEVYSVHQYGMAPALLEWAERHDVPGAREALVLGFKWVLGDNQLGRSMLAPGGLSIRSQIRKGERDSKRPRMSRAVVNALLGRSGGLIDNAEVELRLECRSYELGWLLWSFGGRSDLTELSNHDAFEAPQTQVGQVASTASAVAALHGHGAQPVETNLKKKLGSLIPYPAIQAGRKVLHYGRRRCQVCEARYRARLDNGYGFPVLEQLQVVGGLMRRADACPICHSGSRERLVWFYLTKERGLLDGVRSRLRVAHFAPEKGLSQRLQQQFPDSYQAYDFVPERYRHLRRVEFQNLQQLSLASASVDLLICNHVMEHVFDLSAALREVRRVLAVDGLAIMQVPFALKLDRMRDGGQRASPAERIARFGQQDHVRLFTRQDYMDSLSAAGFSVTTYEPFQTRSEEATAWDLDPFETLVVIEALKTQV